MGDKKTILIVDDDEEIAKSMLFALENQFEVRIAKDGVEGFMQAKLTKPDLIILDIMMPRESGITVLEKLRHAGLSQIPIILITAGDSSTYEWFAQVRGINHFLKKPFSMNDLVACVDDHLGDEE